MLSKEKVESLTKYLSELKNKLTSPTPKKHVAHPRQYQEFVRNEIHAVSAKLDANKLELSGK